MDVDMHRLVFKQPVKIDTERGYVASIESGVEYLMTDHHALGSVPDEVCCERARFEKYAEYRGGVLDGKSLLILWLAGFGDTISFAPALISLQESNPGSRIDLITVPALFEIVASSGFNGRLIEYPATSTQAGDYDLFLPLEKLSEDPDYYRLSSIDFFGKKLFQEGELSPVRFDIDPVVRQRMVLPATDFPRVGVQVQSLSSVRSYPMDLLAEILRGLVSGGCEVHLLGADGDCTIPSAPPRLYNQCGKSRSFQEAVALVEQMDVMICPDSFLMHLAGTLEIPTVAIFSTIPARLRINHYSSVVALEPDTTCSPCLVVRDDCCPEGHGECVALRSPSVSPEAVLRAVRTLCPPPVAG